MNSTASPRRRWFRFTLRALFVLMAVLGVFLAWLGVQLKWISDRHEALAAIRRNGRVETGREESLVYTHAPPDPVDAPWSIRILGELGIASIHIHVEQNEESPEARRQEVQRLFPEASVSAGQDWPVDPNAEMQTESDDDPFKGAKTRVRTFDDSE